MTSARFFTRAQVAEQLNISMAHAYALIRRKELRAAKIGGRGDRRDDRSDHHKTVSSQSP